MAVANVADRHGLPPGGASAVLERNLRLVTFAWGFGAAWMYVTTGSVLTQYARLLGMPEYGFGLLAALPFAGTLAQLPASYFIEKFGHRKQLFIIAGLAHRLLWIVVAAIPLFVAEAAWWQALVLLMMCSSIAGHVATPGVLAWMGDMVPSRLRGRYFSRRLQFGQITGLVTTLGVGYALDWAEAGGQAALKTTISAVLVGAALLGAADFALLCFVRGERESQPDRNIGFLRMLRVPLQDVNFRRYIGFTASFVFAVGFIGQYIWLYVFDVVLLSNAAANMLLVAVPLVVSMLSIPLWGRLIDRYGRRPVLLISGILVVNGATAWVFVTPGNWWLGYSIAVVSMFGFPGLDLASFNLLLGLTTAPGSRRQNSAYIAVNSVVVAIAGVCSGLFGGFVAGRYGDWHGVLLGWPLTYHSLLFLLSGVLRAVSLVFALRIEDHGAHSTRSALRYMSSNIYSNLQQGLFLPVRRFGRLSSRVFRLHLR